MLGVGATLQRGVRPAVLATFQHRFQAHQRWHFPT